jgi:hypothetical protein
MMRIMTESAIYLEIRGSLVLVHDDRGHSYRYDWLKGI